VKGERRKERRAKLALTTLIINGNIYVLHLQHLLKWQLQLKS